MTRFLRALLSSLPVLLLAACVSAPPERPDLARLYEADTHDPRQPPVILIHGLMGSTLVDAGTGKEYWPGGLGALAFSTYKDLAQLRNAEAAGLRLVPGDLFYKAGRTDFYRGLTDALEQVGRFRRATPGDPVRGEDDRRRYYVLLYDWRKENLEAVRQLHALIDQVRRDYGDPDLPVDILAHSNGGLIANYYLRYGTADVLDQAEFTPWDEGGKRIRRMVLLGTPAMGSVVSLERLQQGFKIALRTVPVEVLVTFATPFETLPHPDAKVIYGPDGQLVDLNIYSVDTWRRHRWGVFSPEVEARVLAAAHGGPEPVVQGAERPHAGVDQHAAVQFVGRHTRPLGRHHGAERHGEQGHRGLNAAADAFVPAGGHHAGHRERAGLAAVFTIARQVQREDAGAGQGLLEDGGETSPVRGFARQAPEENPCVHGKTSFFRSLHLVAAAGAARRGLIRGGRRFAPLRCAHPPGAGAAKLAAFACALSAQTVAASQSTKRALARPTPDSRTQPPRKIAPTGQRLPQHEMTWLSTGRESTPFLPRRVWAGRSAPCEAPRSAVAVAARAARFVD